MSIDEQTLRDIATRHGFSEDAARALLAALRSGGGGMAQFSHPDLGGMGQWSRGGMLMIGDMNNSDLKARVGALADDLARAMETNDNKPASSSPWAVKEDKTSNRGGSGDWWPGDLGRPGASGAQNGVRYAAFPGSRRLAIEQDGKVTVYDTADHQISGVSQSQSGTGPGSLRFTSQQGDVELASLAKL